METRANAGCDAAKPIASMMLTYGAAAAVCTCCSNEASHDTVELVLTMKHNMKVYKISASGA